MINWAMANLGDVPGWFEAIATLLAFGGTVWLLGIESRRRKEELGRNVEAQASKVAHWLDRSRSEDWEMKYRNVSDVPVYRIELRLFVDGVGKGRQSMNRIAPMESEQTRERINRWLNAEIPWDASGQKIDIDMTFVDASGRGWCRDLDGFLVALQGVKAEPPQRLGRYTIPERQSITYVDGGAQSGDAL